MRFAKGFTVAIVLAVFVFWFPVAVAVWTGNADWGFAVAVGNIGVVVGGAMLADLVFD